MVVTWHCVHARWLVKYFPRSIWKKSLRALVEQGDPTVSVDALPDYQSRCQYRGSSALETLAPLILAIIPPLSPPTLLLMVLPYHPSEGYS